MLEKINIYWKIEPRSKLKHILVISDQNNVALSFLAEIMAILSIVKSPKVILYKISLNWQLLYVNFI